MENYDKWKTGTPAPQEKCCAFCGEPSEERYCSTECKKAYESEN